MIGIKDILKIVNTFEENLLQELLGDGKNFGIHNYRIKKPEVIAQAFFIPEDFISNNNSVLILGDNIFMATTS